MGMGNVQGEVHVAGHGPTVAKAHRRGLWRALLPVAVAQWKHKRAEDTNSG